MKIETLRKAREKMTKKTTKLLEGLEQQQPKKRVSPVRDAFQGDLSKLKQINKCMQIFINSFKRNEERARQINLQKIAENDYLSMNNKQGSSPAASRLQSMCESPVPGHGFGKQFRNNSPMRKSLSISKVQEAKETNENKSPITSHQCKVSR